MSSNVKAAELKMIAGGSMTGPLRQIVPQFEHATGHKLVIIKAAGMTPG
jgi:molybdate transport system substrate-binding protein